MGLNVSNRQIAHESGLNEGDAQQGISQEKLPLYLGFFPFVHNARLRGIGLLQPLLGVLLTAAVRNP